MRRLLAFLALGIGFPAPAAAGTPVVLPVPGPVELLPAPVGATGPAALLREAPPGTGHRAWRLVLRDGRPVIEEAGTLPGAGLAFLELPGASGPEGVLASLRGQVVFLPLDGSGKLDPARRVSLARSPRLAADRLLLVDLDGDGSRDLLVESWMGALACPARPAAAGPRGWYPLPRVGAVFPGGIEVRARRVVPPVGPRHPRRLWADAGRQGPVLVFRGTPVDSPAPAPPAGPPPLVARVRLTPEPDWIGREMLLPGEPDRVARILGTTRRRGLAGSASLVVLPLVPGEAGLPREPELLVDLPLDPLRQSPRLRLADVDGDGTGDLVVGGVARGGRGISVSVIPGRNGGGFGPAATSWRGTAGRDAFLLAIEDLDGDGRPDLLARARETVLFWKGAPPGSPVPWPRRPTARWKLPSRDDRAVGPVRVLAGPGGVRHVALVVQCFSLAPPRVAVLLLP